MFDLVSGLGSMVTTSIPAVLTHLAMPWDWGLIWPLDGGFDVSPTAPPGAEKLLQVMGWLKWIGLAVCMAGLIIGGAMMAFNHRRGNGIEVAKPIALSVVGAVIIGAASSLVGFFAT